MSWSRPVSLPSSVRAVSRRSSRSSASSGMPVGALLEFVTMAGATVHTLMAEGTTRRRIDADLARDLETIRTTGDLLMGYLDHAHDERRQTFQRLFDALDAAMALEDPALVGATLDGIVQLATHSPFADLADLAAVRAKLADPQADWSL